MISDCEILEKAPSTDQFLKLRERVAWGAISEELADNSLSNSLYHVSIYQQGALIGMGRVVGDGYLYFYIQDVVVHPEYQGHGLGALLMKKIEDYLSTAAVAGSTVGLFAVRGKEAFYEKFGYQIRSGNPMGLGMCRFT